MNGPLAGLRVLEVGHILAGPYATMLLADLGARVTKVEPPGGDLSRQVSDAYFASLNRNKRSVRVDLSAGGTVPVHVTLPDGKDAAGGWAWIESAGSQGVDAEGHVSASRPRI